MSEIQYDPSCVDCRHDAGKDAPETTWQCSAHVRAERDWLRARLAMKWTIEEQYEAACGDRDALLRMVETLRPRVSELEKDVRALTNERNAALTLAEQRGAAYDVTWREVESLRERLDQFEAHTITVKSALDDRADRDALRGDRAFLLEMLEATIKTGTKDPRLDARLSEVAEDYRRALAASEVPK